MQAPATRLLGLLALIPALLGNQALGRAPGPIFEPAVAATRATEVVRAPLDLAGARAGSQLTLAATALLPGGAEALLDGDPATVARLSISPARLVVDLDPPRELSRVDLVPGDDATYQVVLTVVTTEGRRFAAGEASMAGEAARFGLTDVDVARLELEVERDEGEEVVALADLRLLGRMRIDSLTLGPTPETLPAGGRFPLRVLGLDAVGGRPDLTGLAQVSVSPASALSIGADGLATATVGGQVVTLRPYLGELEGERRTLRVVPLGEAPPAPAVRAGLRTVELDLEGSPPFEVHRRGDGDEDPVVLGRSHGPRFVDDEVEPGQAYHYAVRRIDRFGNPLTHLGREARVRTFTRPPEGLVDVGRLPVLVLVYEDTFEPDEVARLPSSLEAARAFVFRHTGGRVTLDVQTLTLSGTPPNTRGPSMSAIARQLRLLGVEDDEYGLVYALADGMGGSWGNFTLLGRTGGAMGRSLSVPTPSGLLGDDPVTTWSVVHELGHVLGSLVASAAGCAPLPSGHFEQDLAQGVLGRAAGLPFDVGDAWDGQAALLTRVDFWDQVPPPYRRPLEVIDTDGDGLPDADARLPYDEQRLGCDPGLDDTDGDGLSDLAEMGVGLYRGSDPNRADTDGDGLPDGEDPWPLTLFTGQIVRGTVPRPLASSPGNDLRLDACWQADRLVFVLTSTEPLDVFLELDGSGDLGRWETDVVVRDGERTGADVWAGPRRLTARAHAAPLGLFVGDEPVEGGQVRLGRTEDGRHRMAIEVPRRLPPGATDVLVPQGAPDAQGLRLSPGRLLGLSVVVTPAREGLHPPFEDDAWRSLFELHRLLDARLVEAPAEGAVSEAGAPSAGAPSDASGRASEGLGEERDGPR